MAPVKPLQCPDFDVEVVFGQIQYLCADCPKRSTNWQVLKSHWKNEHAATRRGRPWVAMGISWNAWRAGQALKAAEYYRFSHGKVSQQDAADQYGISLAALVPVIRVYRERGLLDF